MRKTYCDLCGHEITNYDYEKESMEHYISCVGIGNGGLGNCE